MAKISIPFNISLLNLTQEMIRNLRPVTDLSIFDSTKESFHPEGLFSNQIFGPVGSELRNKRFAYIDIKLPILHPIIFKSLTQARKIYTGILEGTEYAVFSYAENDFVKSNPVEGETGYNFFMTYYKQIVIKDSGSSSRKRTNELLEKYRDKAIIDKVIVLPAGLRDVDFEDGRPVYDDINDHYKRLISLSNNISKNIIELDPSLVDNTRYRIQETMNLLYDSLLDRVEGKKKLYLGKWASRRIFNGTRNVLTASSPSGRYLGDKSNIGYNDTIVGLYQMLKSVLPVSIYHIQNSILKDIFLDPNHPAILINKDTWELEKVDIDSDIFDYYQSVEGIEKMITDFKDEDMKHKAVMVNDHYVCLTYSDDKYFKIFRDIKELPSNLKREDVHPTTYFELFYSCLYNVLNKYFNIVVRYPISGTGSNVPSTSFIMTTVKSEVKEELDDMWTPSGKIAVSWPILGETSMTAMSPPVSALGAMGADHDGDTGSYNTPYSDEATEEIGRFLQTRAAYIDTMGNIIKSSAVDTVNYVCFNLSE